MSRPDLTTDEERHTLRQELRAVAAPWRVGGIALILVAAIALVAAKGQALALTSPLMTAGFAILGLGWILIFVGTWLRARRRARRLRAPE